MRKSTFLAVITEGIKHFLHRNAMPRGKVELANWLTR